VLTAQGKYDARAVILAAGGKSWPSAGSSGDGYHLAAELGHQLVPVRPALVPLVVEQEWVRGLSGLSCPAVRAVLLKDGKPVGQASGELLWTHFGLSGPVILRLSRDMASESGPPDGLKPDWQIQLDLRPDLKAGDLLSSLTASIAGKPRHLLKNVLGGSGILPGALLLSLMQVCQIPAVLPASQASKQQLQRLAGTIKQLTLPVTGTRGFRESMVTAGGVDLREIDPRTMASRLVSGLFLAGEVIDLDGDTGGYNLQAAFSTGFLAGRSAAEYCRKPAEVQSEV
jgi:predicted Rossmann fold flavoprotein